MLGARTVLVLAMLLTLSPRHEAGPHIPFECCFDYRKAAVPLAKLKSFYRTPNECFKPAVVFETKNGTKICANPKKSWVGKAVVSLEIQKRQRAS